MSAEPERVFSRACRTISWDRMRLGSKNIEMGECLKSWQRVYKTIDGKSVARLKALNERFTPNLNAEADNSPLEDNEYLEGP